MFQTRLAMAKETVNALMRADTERVREFVELKDRVRLLQLEASSHMLRASQAEARVSDFRSRLSRANACREDIRDALKLQHSVICELQSENAWLKSEKMKQRRHFRDAIERKDSVIQRY
ncbi:hypothetical protein, conserved [Eimeria maxima]|uniref:Uncharacterized protein n=1 Tax=Eimeria maxima TaxID=5804 RepID=U6MBN6_EIMMA|nr:hypothetical protein, conserved [Eimeria maxima]CDJ59050.1 hypothetical protein, conserved [Eimeria maxima]